MRRSVLGGLLEKGPYLLIVLLWLFHTINNWLWLSTNAAPTGWDRPQHLVRTLTYNEVLREFNLRTLFTALTWDSYRPPLFFLSAIPLYKVFGVSWDVATMVNTAYMAILLLAVYGLGRKMYADPRIGLLASFIVSLFPLVFVMSRFFYIEFALTAMVALSLYWLVCSQGFQNRRFAWLFGLSLGLGMLIKWTFLAFLVAPLGFVLLRYGVIGKAGDRTIRSFPRWPWAVFSAAVGLGGALLWYLPNREAIEGVSLGHGLLPLWWFLLTLTIYSMGFRSTRATNLAASLCLSLLIASLWYLPRIDFIGSFFDFAYEGRGNFANFTRLSAYTFYPEQLVKEGLSLPLFALLVIILILHLGSVKKIKLGAQNGALLALWVVGPLVIFTLSSRRDSRLIMPVLPALAIALAWGLLSPRPEDFAELSRGARAEGLRNHWIRLAGISLLATFSLVQFFILSYDALAWVPPKTSINLPLVGSVSPFASGGYIEWPNSGVNDGRYWVMPAIFETIAEDSGGEEVNLAFLLNRRTINGYHLNYLALTQYPQIQLWDLSRLRNRVPIYPQIFGGDYFVLRSNEEPEIVVDRILTAPPPAFEDAFSLLNTYPLPNGETIHLFKNWGHEMPKHFPPELLNPVTNVKQVDLGEKILFLGYDLDGSRIVSEGKISLTLYWLGLKPLEEDYTVYLKIVNGVYHIWGQQAGRPYWDGKPTNTWKKGQVTEDIREIDILPGTPPGSYEIEVILHDSGRDQTLSPPDDADLLLGPIELPRRQPPAAESLDIEHRLEANLGDKFRLLGYNIESGFRPGVGLHLTLFWQALAEVDRDYTVFTHLVDRQGKIWGQKDNQPVDGFYPTSLWTKGEIVRDQYDLTIAPDTRPGQYRVEVGLYLRETGERLSLLNREGTVVGDKIELLEIEVKGD